MCRKEIEASHRVIRPSHQPVYLIGLGAQHGVVASQILLSRSAVLEAKAQPLDRTQAPGNPGREELIDKGVGMRQHGPAFAGRSCETVLNPWLEHERHEWLRIAEERGDRRIALQQVLPLLLGRS